MMGIGMGLADQVAVGLGFWSGFELNWTVLAVWTQTASELPQPIANTPRKGRCGSNKAG